MQNYTDNIHEPFRFEQISEDEGINQGEWRFANFTLISGSDVVISLDIPERCNGISKLRIRGNGGALVYRLSDGPIGPDYINNPEVFERTAFGFTLRRIHDVWDPYLGSNKITVRKTTISANTNLQVAYFVNKQYIKE